MSFAIYQKTAKRTKDLDHLAIGGVFATHWAPNRKFLGRGHRLNATKKVKIMLHRDNHQE